VKNPLALRQILVQTLTAADGKPGARSAIAQAIAQRMDRSADILSDDPAIVRAGLLANLRQVMKKPRAREAFVEALGEASPQMALVLADHPDLLARMMRDMSAAVKDKPSFIDAVFRGLIRRDECDATKSTGC
jgi:hypothetical protein